MFMKGRRPPQGDRYFRTWREGILLRREALSGAAVTVLSKSLSYIVHLGSAVILARILTPADFGLVAMVTAVSMVIMDVGMLGLNEATIQREGISHNQISTLFWINSLLSLSMFLLFALLSPIIAWFYGEPKVKTIAVVIGLCFIFRGISTQQSALLRRNMEFLTVAAVEIIAELAGVLLAIFSALLGLGYWALVWRRVVTHFIIAAGVWSCCDWKPGLPGRNTGIGPMLKFGANSLGSQFTQYFTKNVDKVLVGWRYGSLSLGYYDRAYHLFVMPVNQLTFPLTSVAVSTLSKLKNDQKRYKQYYLKAVSVISFVGMFLSLILTIEGRDLILLLLGDQWERAGVMLSLFGPGVGIYLIYGTNGWLHLSAGRAERWFRWTIISSLITLFLLLAGLRFGAEGVAVAYTSSFYILICPALWYAGRPVDLAVTSILAVVWRYICSAAIAGLLCWYLLNGVDGVVKTLNEAGLFLRILISGTLCSLAYIGCIILLFRSIGPIKEIISIAVDMIPRRSKREKARPGQMISVYENEKSSV